MTALRMPPLEPLEPPYPDDVAASFEKLMPPGVPPIKLPDGGAQTARAALHAARRPARPRQHQPARASW